MYVRAQILNSFDDRKKNVESSTVCRWVVEKRKLGKKSKQGTLIAIVSVKRVHARGIAQNRERA